MIGILLTSLVFIFGLIYTLSNIPPTKKFLTLFFQSSFQHDHINPPKTQLSLIKKNSFNNRADHVLRGVFATFDKNSDGYITKQELKESLQNIGISAGERDVIDMVEKVDSNGDGLIDFHEFCQLFVSNNLLDDEDGDLKEAFDVFDGNKDGLITVDELGLVLSCLGFSEGKKMEDCKEMIRKVDMDGDGMVNFYEFKRMMKTALV